MDVAMIENELGNMTNTERQVVIEIATRLIRGKTNVKPNTSLDIKRSGLRRSAEIMHDEYLDNKSLTEMTSLDGAEFFDA